MKIAKKDREKWQASKIEELKAEIRQLKKEHNKEKRQLKSELSASEDCIGYVTEEAVLNERKKYENEIQKEKKKAQEEIDRLLKQQSQIDSCLEKAKRAGYREYEYSMERELQAKEENLNRQFEEKLNARFEEKKGDLLCELMGRLMKMIKHEFDDGDRKRMEGFKEKKPRIEGCGAIFGNNLIITFNPKNGRRLSADEIYYILRTLQKRKKYIEIKSAYDSYSGYVYGKKMPSQEELDEYIYKKGMELLPLYKELII